MEFQVVAYDGNDPGARDRRLKVRAQHLEGVCRLQEKGHFINGGAILSEAGEMIGSTLYMEFASREELDAWLTADPYTTGGVWKEVSVAPIRLVERRER